MKRRLLIALVILVVLVVVVIVIPVGAVTLDVDQETYDAGQTVTITLINVCTGRVYHGQPFTVERFEDGDWVRVSLDRIFTLEVRTLSPGRKFEQSFVPRHDLADTPTPGKYRVVKGVRVDTILGSYNPQLETRTLVAGFTIK